MGRMLRKWIGGWFLGVVTAAAIGALALRALPGPDDMPKDESILCSAVRAEMSQEGEGWRRNDAQPKDQDMYAEKVVQFFKKLSIDSMGLVEEFYNSDAVFRDPLGEVRGAPAIRGYYEKLYKNVEAIRFEFSDVFEHESKVSAAWSMHLRAKGLNRGKEIVVCGVSVIHFDSATTQVRYHRDYFDMGEFVYQYVPILNRLITFVNRRMKGAL